ncbi:MAG: nucleotidyltransferase domain-containing protein [Betaproteobacteria bacterium]|nr:nucleotidyltransferase domain-containing protein [Betaproteobacteria bacterium]
MAVGNNLAINEKQRVELVDLLQRYLPETRVWAYGSCARLHSDLDLVVFALPQQSISVGELRAALDESDLPFRVDLHVWDELPERFKTQIEAEYVCLA